jgi:hypothetical protein
MLNSIVVMLKRAAGIVWGINVDALDFARKFLFKRLEREQIIAQNQFVVEKVVICDTVLGVIRLLRVFQQDARLQPGPVLLPDPGQFEFLFF